MKYLFIIKDLEKTGFDIFNESLNMKKWFFKNDRNTVKFKLKIDDEVLVYKAGKDGGYILGKFKILGTLSENKQCNDLFFEQFNFFVQISDGVLFEKRLFLRKYANQLEFVKNKNNFGSSLISGAKKISENDFNFIMKTMEEI
ncbi:MAG: hypothetical protein RSB33_06420 [Cetobacterium sp.]